MPSIFRKRKMTKLIKSKERVKKFAEVYTPDYIVKDMCDLIPSDVWDNIASTFLEPACGNGNFLVEILARKYERCKDVRDGLVALSSVVGVDIQEDNCAETRERLLAQFLERFNPNNFCQVMAYKILQSNIVCDDCLDPKTERLKALGITAAPKYVKAKKKTFKKL